MNGLAQDELILQAKTVVQGLEALRSEHQSILEASERTVASQCADLGDEPSLLSEKTSLVHKSLEMIELGIGEAQVYYQKLRLSTDKMFCMTANSQFRLCWH